MLVKVNGINYDNKMVNVTELDIDDYGSVIPLEDLDSNYLLKMILLLRS
jgi:hypothetical protein